MYKVKSKNSESEFSDLSAAMFHARELNEHVEIIGEDIVIVGVFGVDSIENGKCPDGVEYDWNKSSRIGAERRG